MMTSGRRRGRTRFILAVPGAPPMPMLPPRRLFPLVSDRDYFKLVGLYCRCLDAFWREVGERN